jgi:lipopolysaccharide export LptBFGC system permease protein LptF
MTDQTKRVPFDDEEKFAITLVVSSMVSIFVAFALSALLRNFMSITQAGVTTIVVVLAFFVIVNVSTAVRLDRTREKDCPR